MMFGLIKKIFIGLLTNIVNASKHEHIKKVSLSNQKCITQPIFINLHPNEIHSRILLLSIFG